MKVLNELKEVAKVIDAAVKTIEARMPEMDEKVAITVIQRCQNIMPEAAKVATYMAHTANRTEPKVEG